MDLLAGFHACPIMPILRGGSRSLIPGIVDAVAASGMAVFEITMNTPGAPELIREAVRASAKRVVIGAGTVLSTRDMDSAVEAGAEFIVSPVADERVIRAAVAAKIPVFPGALTPGEISRAWDMGATMVKVFPVRALGPSYIRDIKGPLNRVKIMACSGVTPGNARDFFEAGADAIAVGGSVFSVIEKEPMNFAAITSSLKEYKAGAGF